MEQSMREPRSIVMLASCVRLIPRTVGASGISSSSRPSCGGLPAIAPCAALDAPDTGRRGVGKNHERLALGGEREERGARARRRSGMRVELADPLGPADVQGVMTQVAEEDRRSSARLDDDAGVS